MSADNQNSKVEQLPILINAVLLQIKNAIEDVAFLSTPSAGKAPAEKSSLSRPQGLAYQIIPKLNEQFVNIIDDLEFEILQAKAAIEDDILVIRRKRAEREAALHAERNQSSRVENTVEDQTLSVRDTTVKRSESQAPNEVVNLESEDVDMLNDFEVIPKPEDEAPKTENTEGAELTTDGTFDEKGFTDTNGTQPANPAPDDDMHVPFDFDFSDLGGTITSTDGEVVPNADTNLTNGTTNVDGETRNANPAQSDGVGELDLLGDFAFLDLPELTELDANGNPIQPTTTQNAAEAQPTAENPDMANAIDLTALDGAPEADPVNQEEAQKNTQNSTDFFAEALDLQDFGDNGINLADFDGWFQ